MTLSILFGNENKKKNKNEKNTLLCVLTPQIRGYENFTMMIKLCNHLKIKKFCCNVKKYVRQLNV